MDVYGCTKTKYDIPLNHLDYGYVSKCQDTKELEKIVKILRSGKEGSYPDLEKCAEDRLVSLDPLNKLLRKPDSLKTTRDLEKEEWQEINEDLQNWVQDVRVADEKLGHVADEKGYVGVLPPVRSTAANIDTKKKSTSESTSGKSEKRVKPRDYREWDKFNIEAELEKADNDDKSKVNPVKQFNKPSVSDTIDKSGCNDEVTQMRAEREKNKGNEAFRSGDYDEAVVYYSRSLALIETVAARNNRAQAYIKLKKWNQALDDCEFVLKVESTNLKALLRRAVANQGLASYDHAKKDIEAVLQKEPNNKQALEVKKSVDKVLGDWKTSGRRMVIEEVDGSDSEDNEAQTNMKNIQKSATSNESSDKTSSVQKTNIKADDETRCIHDTGVTKSKSKDETVAAATDSDKKKSDDAVNAGNLTMQDSVITDPSRQSSKSSLTSGDGTSEALPPAVQALKEEGNDLFRKGQYGDALDKYTAAIQVLTGLGRDVVNLSTLYSNRAACLMKVGDCQGCIIDCDSALALCPGSTKPLLRRAMAYETLEKYRQAYVDYRQVLLSDSNVEAAQQGADRCSNMLQRLDGSGWRDKLPTVSSSSNLAGLAAGYRVNESQSSINEKTFEACKAQGNSVFSKGEFVKAIDLFTKCIELFPDRVVPYTNRALCYLRLEKYDDVLSDCNQALSIEFHNVKALFRRAQAYKMLERYEESMIDLETLLKIDASNVAAKKELQTVVKLKDELRDKRLQASLRKHRQRVRIEEVDTSDEELPGKKPVETKSDAAVNYSAENVKASKPKTSTVPTLSKISAFEFMQAWGSLKGTTDIEPYVKILDQVQPADIPKLITNKLDSDLLFTVIRCANHLIARGEAQRAYEFLNSLTLLSRFETIAMFLSDSEKKELSNVFQQLSTSSDALFNSTLISSIRQKYGL